MKARIIKEKFDIHKQIEIEASKSKEEDELYFYRNMYEAYQNLYNLYKDGYNEEKVLKDITRCLTPSEKAKEYIRLSALQTNILSLLVGLNREALQEANSKGNRGLFQYLDYKSTSPVILGTGNTVINAHECSKIMCKELGFNKDEEGPFPYMLEIIKTDNRNRPYDYVTKIRNALEHGEYYQEKGNVDIVHITNHDDDGNLTFEGNLLLWSYRYFVEDFYGIGLGVTDHFRIFNFPITYTVKNKKELIEFLKDTSSTIVKFTKIPEQYKFTGQEALFAKLNKCFSLDSMLDDDVFNVLEELKTEGVEYEKSDVALSDYAIGQIVEYLETTYGDEIYKDNRVLDLIHPVVKLVNSPNSEISNCLSNILRYIDLKKNFLSNNILDKKIFAEQHHDQNLTLAFQYALLLLKTNIASYAMENSNFEMLKVSQPDLSSIAVSPNEEYTNRVTEKLIKTGDSMYAWYITIIEGIRNALAHGKDRITIFTGKKKNIKFSDKFDPKHELHICGGIDDFNKILSNSCFEPKNIKMKKDNVKVKKMTNNN